MEDLSEYLLQFIFSCFLSWSHATPAGFFVVVVFSFHFITTLSYFGAVEGNLRGSYWSTSYCINNLRTRRYLTFCAFCKYQLYAAILVSVDIIRLMNSSFFNTQGIQYSPFREEEYV